MADIKQIKIGNTTYNIEPYTDYLPKTGGTLTGSLEVQGNINVAGNGTIKINAKEVALKSDIPTDYLTTNSDSQLRSLVIGNHTQGDEQYGKGDLWAEGGILAKREIHSKESVTAPLINTVTLEVEDFLSAGYISSGEVYVGPDDNVYISEDGISVNGDITTDGNINIGGDLHAVTVITDGFVEAEEGIISYADLQVDGDTSVGGNLTTTGNIMLEGYISTPEIYVGAGDEVFLDSSGITINGESVALKSDIPTDYLPKTGGSVNGNVAIGGNLDVQGVLSTGQKQVALKSDIPTDYLPKTGGNVSGHIYLTGANPGSSTANTSQIVFGTQNENHLALTSNTRTLVLNPSISDTSNQIVLYLDKQSSFPSGISSPNGTISAKTLKQDGKSVITSSTATTLTTSSAAPTVVASSTTTSIQKYAMSFSDGVLYIRPDGEVSVSLGTHTHTTSAHTHTIDTHKH